MFVFVYSSYHLKLSFPHLVILTTLQTPKTCLVVLGIRRTGYPWHYLKYAVPGYAWHYLKYSELFWIPKTILLKSSRNPHPPPPKKKKIPGIENFKPQKTLRSSPSLEIRSTPWVWYCVWTLTLFMCLLLHSTYTVHTILLFLLSRTWVGIFMLLMMKI